MLIVNAYMETGITRLDTKQPINGMLLDCLEFNNTRDYTGYLLY